MKIIDELDLNIIRIKEFTGADKTLFFDDLEEFFKLSAKDATFFIDKSGDLLQLQEGMTICLVKGEKKLEEVSIE